MIFTIVLATNCDPKVPLKNNHEVVKFLSADRCKAYTMAASLCCCACCFFQPSSPSVLTQRLHAPNPGLGIPPKELEILDVENTDDSSRPPVHAVIVCKQKINGVEIHTPLLFTDNVAVAKQLLFELNQIYVKSTQMTDLMGGTSLSTLDAQAKVWHEIFNLPPTSRGTVELARSAEMLDGPLGQTNETKTKACSVLQAKTPTPSVVSTTGEAMVRI